MARFGEGAISAEINANTLKGWQRTGVPAYRIVEVLLATSAQSMQGGEALNLTAPEGLVEEQTFQDCWRVIGKAWRVRGTKPQVWASLVAMVLSQESFITASDLEFVHREARVEVRPMPGTA